MLFIWKYIENGNAIEFNKMKFSLLTCRAIFEDNFESIETQCEKDIFNGNFFELLYIRNKKICYEKAYHDLYPAQYFIFNVTNENLNIINYWQKESKFVEAIYIRNDIIFKNKVKFDEPMCETDENGIMYCYKTSSLTNHHNAIAIKDSNYIERVRSADVSFII